MKTRQISVRSFSIIVIAVTFQIYGIPLIDSLGIDVLLQIGSESPLKITETAFGQSTTSLTKILSSDIAAGDWFGDSLDVDGTTAIVGAYKDDDNGNNSGSAYIFSYDGSSWVEGDKLLASDGAPGDLFAFSSRIANQTVLIGAPEHDINGAQNAGAVYVFSNGAGGWSEEAKLFASDYTMYDTFGWASAIVDDTIIIGSPGSDHSGLGNPGAAYVYARNGSDWSNEAKLVAPNLGAGNSGARFGYSIAMDENIAVIGSPFYETNRGAAYIFERVNGDWSLQQEIYASGGLDGRRFGSSVDIDGSRLVVSAPHDNQIASKAGALYVFEHDGNSWTETAKLTTSDARASDRLGYFTIGLADDFIGIGSAYTHGQSTNSGAVYLFGLTGSGWSELQKLTASDSNSFDRFGIATKIDSGHVFIGSELSDTAGTDSGSVYIYSLEDYAPPTITISSPIEGATIAHNRAISLTAVASDSVDGPLTNSIEWKSSIDGALGTGGLIANLNLTAGNHDISAVVTDSHGVGATATVAIVVGVPDQVTQISPSNTIEDTSPLFTWRPTEAADGYIFVLYDDTNNLIVYENQSAPYDNTICTGDNTSVDICTVQLDLSLNSGVNYKWLVRAINSHGFGQWSLFP